MAKKSSRPKPNRKKPAKSHPSAMTVMVTLLICAVSVGSVATWERYAFAEIVLFPLWYVALALGLLCGWLFVAKLMEKGHSAGKRIGTFFLISVLCFFAAGATLAHLNHLLDPSDPIRYTVTIQDTEYRAGGKGPSHYEFTVTVQGDTFDIDVPRKHYYTFDEGDLYVIEYREGAFDEPYYIAVGGVTESDGEP